VNKSIFKSKYDIKDVNYNIRYYSNTSFISFNFIKKKIKLKGSGGFYFKDYSYVTLLNFFLVILFFEKDITTVAIKNKLSIIQSMDMLIIHDGVVVF